MFCTPLSISLSLSLSIYLYISLTSLYLSLTLYLSLSLSLSLSISLSLSSLSLALSLYLSLSYDVNIGRYFNICTPLSHTLSFSNSDVWNYRHILQRMYITCMPALTYSLPLYSSVSLYCYFNFIWWNHFIPSRNLD